jgi:hypothetical protein
MNSYLLKATNDHANTYLEAKIPALASFHSDHPLMANLPSTIEQTEFPSPVYTLKISDSDARTAARTGDGYPSLLSKVFGTDSGVFVHCTLILEDRHLVGIKSPLG